MDQYLLFAGDQFYPDGGWQDFKGSFTTLKAALREAAAWGADWWQIVDLKTGKIVEEGTRGGQRRATK